MKKLLRTALLSACMGLSMASAAFADAQPATAFTPAQVNQLHQIIHDYLVANPQVLVEASRVLQAQQEKKMQASAMSGIEQNKAGLFNDPHSPTIGSKTAPATLVEFFDYQCGHCIEMAPQIEKLVSTDKNLRVVFKEFPIFGGMSNDAAKAALAANMQDNGSKYYAFHNLLFTSGPLNKDKIMTLAKKAGLNVDTLKKDMSSPAVESQLKANYQLAQDLKLMGTPAFIITNKAQTKFRYIPGATTVQDLQTQINAVQQ